MIQWEKLYLNVNDIFECSYVDHVSKGLEFPIKVARPIRIKTPGWSGLMQMFQIENYPGVS